ncbi:MAG: cellulase family glycosylhydrolase, partial [Sedimentisphaerales bacterium]
INIVRTYAPHNLILVAGPYYSQLIGPAAANPLTGSNIVMVSHIYPGHWLDSYWGPSYKAQINTCLTRYPVFMSEWGFSIDASSGNLNTGTITNYGQPLMDFDEARKISNSAWVASYDWEPPMFYSTWVLRVGEAQMGGFVKDTLYLRRDANQPECPYGDFTGEGLVNISDIPGFCEVWLVNDCNETADLDLNDDCIINFYEYAFFARNWLEGF